MKKQRKQLIILIVMLLLLVAGYFGVQKYNEVQSSKSQEESVEMLLDLESASIEEISYLYNGQVLTFIKDGDVWKYGDDRELSINQTRLGYMISAVAQLETQGKIETVVELADYGLTEPTQEITLVANGQTYVIWIGNYNSMTSVSYVTLDGGSTVYAVGRSFSSTFDYSLEELIEEESVEETTQELIEEVESAATE